MNRKKYFAPSLRCIDLENLQSEINALDASKVNMYHLDIMDGHYVANHALSIKDVKAIKKLTNTPLDVHLMVSNPEAIVDLYVQYVDLVYFHLDTVTHINHFIDSLKEKGVQVGIVLNPHQTLAEIQYIIEKIDYVMIMTVDPGYAEQKFIDSTIKKLEKLNKWREQEQLEFKISVDGALSESRITELSQLGADLFVLENAALFNREESYEEIMTRLNRD